MLKAIGNGLAFFFAVSFIASLFADGPTRTVYEINREYNALFAKCGALTDAGRPEARACWSKLGAVGEELEDALRKVR